MEDTERMIERATQTALSCLLPELLEDIDLKPIGQEDFAEFRMMLANSLHLLLDILYQNANLLTEDCSYDTRQLKINLLLLTCEQTAENQLFQTDQKILVNSLSRFLEDNIQHFDEKIFLKVIEKYKKGLNKNCWKKQLGMIHSFPKFCEILLTRKPEQGTEDLLMFMLSVGSLLISHYDPYFKTIGLRIYNFMMRLGDKVIMKDLNITQVIFNESFSLLRKSNAVDFNEELFECLLQAIQSEEFDRKNSSKWSKYDDVMSELLTVFGIESEPSTSKVLLQKIVKFCAIDYEILITPTCETQLETYYKKLRLGRNKENIRTMRWLKKLMEMLIRESPRLMNNFDDSFRILNEFHCIYISTIYTINSQILGEQLIDFTKKFIVLLLQVAKKFKEHREIKQSVALFLFTIQDHQHLNTELVKCLQIILSEFIHE